MDPVISTTEWRQQSHQIQRAFYGDFQLVAFISLPDLTSHLGRLWRRCFLKPWAGDPLPPHEQRFAELTPQAGGFWLLPPRSPGAPPPCLPPLVISEPSPPPTQHSSPKSSRIRGNLKYLFIRKRALSWKDTGGGQAKDPQGIRNFQLWGGPLGGNKCSEPWKAVNFNSCPFLSLSFPFPSPSLPPLPTC